MTADASLDRALHAIADPTRRRILQALKLVEADAKATGKRTAANAPCLCAGDIEERVQLSQPTISHHMAILTKAGLVEATKKGQWRWYRRNEKAIRSVVKTLRGKL
jgi:DNA-binding transcriptional ArsR family regulator